MKTTIDTYPVFDANQVLTDDHLNAVVNYLDEQDRLTRANLVGVGISCDLNATIDQAAGVVGIAKGCAVTSLGYLLTEPESAKLTGYRTYGLPIGDAYAPFMNRSLWELFPDGEPGVTQLSSQPDFLKDKSVVLFLERDTEDLSDCSPSNCDDKGLEVTVALRRLLVENKVVEEITRKLRNDVDISARLDLPDLRLHRFDTPRASQGPVTTRDVLEAFQAIVKKYKVVTSVGDALVKAYIAFQPILQQDYPSNPFGGFKSAYGFLESNPVTSQQVIFMPYYMDFLSDLLAAYDEFRRRGLELTCVCCPPEDWFPRHVVLGPEYRTGWYPSTAGCCGCESLRSEIVMLFARLVEVIRRFNNNPPLRPASPMSKVDPQIRLTPSRNGVAPLSARCIPYYYDFKGSSPLYELWNPELTRKKRAHYNLGYRSNEYAPKAPDFVETPLPFALESCDFLRIEGHLGKDYRRVISTLEALRTSNRLPFEIVAVRTGQLDESLDVDPSEHACRFQDLEAAYKVMREELLCLAKKAVSSLGKFKLAKFEPGKTSRARSAAPSASATMTGAPRVTIPLSGAKSLLGMSPMEARKHFQFELGTIGAAFIENAKDYGLEDLTLISERPAVNATLSALKKLAELTSHLEENLSSVDWDKFVSTVQALQRLSGSISDSAEEGAEDGITAQELNRQIVSVVFACRVDGFLAIRDEYLRRLKQLRELTYFSSYAKEHPSVEHKAGVPNGGTLVIVYHGKDAAESKNGDIYSQTIRTLDEGAVIADFCLPYQCCSDCTPVHFVIGQVGTPTGETPGEAPQLAIDVGTTNTESQAQVEITAAGGKSPYELKVDDQVQGTFSTSISLMLTPGSHIVQVTDAEGVEADAISLVIPDVLATGDITFKDNPTAGTFTASFLVTGGTGPYTSSRGRVEDDKVIIDGLSSGTTEVLIEDSRGWQSTVTISHEVQAADKPCGGEATRSRYPVWAPRPAQTSSYKYRALKKWKLSVADEDNKTIFSEDLAAAVVAIVKSEDITATRHDAVMSSICDLVSRSVAAKIESTLGERAFVIEYDSQHGTLLIESYSCHNFLIEIEYEIELGGKVLKERWAYDRGAVRVNQESTGESASYSMPTFGVIGLDKRTQTEGTDCAVELTGITSQEVLTGGVTLTPSFGEGVNASQLAYHWRIDSPSLAYSDKPKVIVIAKTAFRVQLLVIDQNACWAFLERWLTPSGTTLGGRVRETTRSRKTPSRVTRKRR